MSEKIPTALLLWKRISCNAAIPPRRKRQFVLTIERLDNIIQIMSKGRDVEEMPQENSVITFFVLFLIKTD